MLAVGISFIQYLCMREKQQGLSPEQRAREKLGRAILQVESLDVFSKTQARSLGTHLGVATYGKVMTQQKYGHLRSIGELIEARREKETPRAMKGLTEYGLLALAVGSKNQVPQERAVLEETDIVKALLARHQVIRPSIIVDEVLVKDLEWLSLFRLVENQ